MLLSSAFSLNEFLKSTKNLDWRNLFDLAWAEFWDMHSLFETATPAFGYFTADTMAVLQTSRDYWKRHGDGPLVTMDAGPNVHLLWRKDQRDQALDFNQMEPIKAFLKFSNLEAN